MVLAAMVPGTELVPSNTGGEHFTLPSEGVGCIGRVAIGGLVWYWVHVFDFQVEMINIESRNPRQGAALTVWASGGVGLGAGVAGRGPQPIVGPSR